MDGTGREGKGRERQRGIATMGNPIKGAWKMGVLHPTTLSDLLYTERP